MKSYNSADTKVSHKGGRMVISSNIKRRMQMVVNAMTTISGKVGRVVFPWEIIRFAQEQNASYSRSDILYALRLCVQAGLVQNVGFGTYQLTLDPRVAKTTIR